MLKGIKKHWRSVLRRTGLSRFGSLGWWQSLLPVWLTPEFYWQVGTYPFRWFLAAWHERTLRSLLWGLPALMLILALALLFNRLRQQSQSIAYEYWEEAQAAIAARNFTRGEMLLDRVLQEDHSNVKEARLALAMLYGETGQQDRAESLFSVLAPDIGRGNADAHRQRAILMAGSATVDSSPEYLDRLHGQLQKASGQETEELSLAWGRYCLAVRDYESALRYLKSASSRFPEVWKTIAELETYFGNIESANASNEKAVIYLQEKVRSGDALRQHREDYAAVLVRRGRADEAQAVLEEGLRKDPEGKWNQLLAQLFVYYHSRLKEEGHQSVDVLLVPIERALEYDPDCGSALNLLMSYVNSGDGVNQELKNILLHTISEGRNAALPHLALGNLNWIENDTSSAILHFERAIELNPKLAVVMNNLAWLLASDPQHEDLDRALGLVESALKERPGDASFLDTRGTILLKLGRYREALKDLEAALPGVRDRAGVHARLAEVYQQLGDAAMAAQHRERELEARSQAADKTGPPRT